MRRLLGRKSVTIIAAIISLTAIPAAGIVATATPAPAVASVRICLPNFTQGCVGAATLNNGDKVVLVASHGGRLINELPQGYTCCGGYHVCRLQFNAAPSQCVGVTSLLTITLRDCSGGNSNNTNWAKKPQSDGSVKWYSPTTLEDLTSHDIIGEQLFSEEDGCDLSCFQRWNN